MVLVATEPLTRNESWVPFARGESRVFVTGEPVWQHVPAAPANETAVDGAGCRPLAIAA